MFGSGGPLKPHRIGSRVLAFARRRWRLLSAVALLLALLSAATIVANVKSLPRPTGPAGISACPEPGPPASALRLVSLNMAHGRGTAFHQSFEADDSFAPRLDALGAFLARVDPHIVALQEADGPSAWSGGLDHVQYIAGSASACAWTRGTHVHSQIFGGRLDYGTALLSQMPLDRGYATAFDVTPLDTKGFTEAAVPTAFGMVTVVSVHLDPAIETFREQQIDSLLDRYASHDGSLILMGDLNCELGAADLCVGRLAATLDMQTCGGPSYPDDAPTRSLDWILVSAHLRIETCEVLGGGVSDHRGIFAEVSLHKPGER
jgi:endonuclease/exonuclease/phosphatase family metal-dependent hydrolase